MLVLYRIGATVLLAVLSLHQAVIPCASAWVAVLLITPIFPGVVKTREEFGELVFACESF